MKKEEGGGKGIDDRQFRADAVTITHTKVE